jgi:hypothetical protein
MTDLLSTPNLELKLALSQVQELGIRSEEGFSAVNVAFVVTCYPSEARGPMHDEREAELATVQSYAKAYGREITGEEFDWGLAVRFADGCEFEWPDVSGDVHETFGQLPKRVRIAQLERLDDRGLASRINKTRQMVARPGSAPELANLLALLEQIQQHRAQSTDA